jgi:hypothetical protein
VPNSPASASVLAGGQLTPQLDARNSAQIYVESKTTHLAGGFAAEEFFGRGKDRGWKAVHTNNRFNASISGIAGDNILRGQHY